MANNKMKSKNSRSKSITLLVTIISLLISFFCASSITIRYQLPQNTKRIIIEDGYNDDGLSLDGTYDTCSLFNTENFEKRLNNKENLENCFVSFDVQHIEPNGHYGYTIWSGEHLNFISDDDKNFSIGQVITVRATKIDTFLGSYLIKYEIFERTTNE